MFTRVTSQLRISSTLRPLITSTCTSTSSSLPTSITTFTPISCLSCRSFATETSTTSNSSTTSTSTSTFTYTPSPELLAKYKARVTKTTAPIHPDILLNPTQFEKKRGESRTEIIIKFLRQYAPITRVQVWMVHGPGGINPILRSKRQLGIIMNNLKRRKLVYTRPPARANPLDGPPTDRSASRKSHNVRGQEWYHYYYHVRKFDGTDPMELLQKQQRQALGLRPYVPDRKKEKTPAQLRFIEQQRANFEKRHGYPFPPHSLRYKPIKIAAPQKPKIVKYDEIKKIHAKLQQQAKS